MSHAFATVRRLLTSDKTVLTFLGLLLAADGVFLLLNFAPAPPHMRDGRLLLEFDQGFAEVFQYIKYFWSAALLVAIACVQRRARYLPWVALFLYFLLDDALSIHEALGPQWLGIEDRVGSLFHEGQELVAVLLLMVPVVALLGASFWRADETYRAATLPLVLLTSVLAFFGVVVDKVHGMIGWTEAINIFIGTIEDWGEMVVMSVVLAYTFALLLRRGLAGDG